MPTVYGLHEIELQPGVEPDEYERFFAEELALSPTGVTPVLGSRFGAETSDFC
jgi:hypothetical protein